MNISRLSTRDTNDAREAQNRGPKPETLKAEGVDWEDAIAHAIKKQKPEGGWPDQKEEGEEDTASD